MSSLKPQGIEYFDSAPVRSSAVIVSAAPPSAVFAVLADHRGWPDWIGLGVTAIQPTSDPEAGVGSSRTLIIGRGALRVQEQFIAWEEPKIWAFTGTDSTPKVFRELVEGFWLEALDGGRTRIIYRMGCELAGVMRLLTPVFGPLWASAVRSALPRLDRTATLYAPEPGGPQPT